MSIAVGVHEDEQPGLMREPLVVNDETPNLQSRYRAHATNPDAFKLPRIAESADSDRRYSQNLVRLDRIA